MRIQWKISLAILAVMTLAGTFGYWQSHRAILSDFQKLEAGRARDRAKRVDGLLQSELEHLKVTNADWSNWDASYTFCENGNSDFAIENLAPNMFVDNRLNLLHYADNNGITVWTQAWDLSERRRIVVEGFAVGEKLPGPLQVARDKQISGLMHRGNRLFLISAHPVLHSNGSGPSNGALVVGRVLDEPLLRKMRRLAQAKFRLLLPGRDISRQSFELLSHRVREGGGFWDRTDGETIETYESLTDLRGEVVALVKITATASMLQRGKRGAQMVLGQILVLTVLMFVVMALVAHLLLVRPLVKLSGAVAQVRSSQGEFVNPFDRRKDEIGVLADSFARMIHRMDESQQKHKMESLLLLAGGVAHDLNNILGPSVALPELIVEDLTSIGAEHDIDFDDVLEDIHMIATSNKRAVEVIKDLSILSSMGHSSKDQLRPNNVIKDVLEMRAVEQSLAQRTGITLRSSLLAQDGIVGAEGAFARLVLNLLINGIDAIPGRGTLSIETRDEYYEKAPFFCEDFMPGHYVRLTVADTGVGIASTDLPRIFEPFFTKKLGIARKGSGLGLAIVHGVVQDFGGCIHVDSDKGKGTTFTLLFKALRNTRTSNHEVRSSVPSRPGEIKVLVVDDEAGQRLLAKRILEKAGYEVTVADDGKHAVKLYEEGADFHLVVLDMVMAEDFDGLDTYRSILAYKSEARVLIASGYAPTDRGKEAISLGARWVLKPYERHILLNTIAEMLGLV